MKIDKSAESACVINLKVVADAEEVKPYYNKVVNLFVRNGEIRGFRKGKAPVQMVKEQFADRIKEEAANACLRELCPKAVKEADLKPIADIGAKDINFSPETGIEFTAIVEVAPEVKLPKYKGIAVERKPMTIADSEVEERVEAYRKAFAKFEDAKEGDTVSDGDFLCIDFKGTVDGTPVEEVCADAKAVGSGTDFWTQVEEGRFIPEVLEAVKGMKAGETKTGIAVTFAAPAPEALVGKTASYDVTVKSFRVRRIPDDAAFLEAAKAESLDALKASFRERLEADAKRVAEDDIRRQVAEALLSGSDFELPPSRVYNQTQLNLQRLAERVSGMGLSASYLEENREKILEDCRENAKNQVRMGYILDAIADAEYITPTEEELLKEAGELAKSAKNPVTPEVALRNVRANGEEQMLVIQIRRTKALELAIASVK